MDGWIKLFRSIQTHWIWQNPEYLKAWITILLTVNHEDKKVLIHGELINCARGQSVLSLPNWSKLLGKNWSIQRVRTFFDLLKSDSMITTEGLQKTTRLTVCNYESYQDIQQTNNRQITFEQQTDNRQITSNKNDKNEKNDKEDIIIPDWRKNFGEYLEVLNHEYDKILSDSDFFETQQKYYPNIDIKLSLEKAIFNFWGTEAGWKHKKKGRSKEIDWRQTFVNAIPMNKVYKQSQSNGQTFKTNAGTKLTGTQKAAEKLAGEVAEKGKRFAENMQNT